MHDTLHSDIKGFIDDTIVLNSFTIFKGWCFHTHNGVYPLRLNINNDIYEVDIKERNDVSIFYNNDAINNCGWKIIVPKNKNAYIQMNIDNDWYNIFKFITTDSKENSINIIPNLINSVNINTAINVSFNTNKPSFIVVDNFYKNPDEIRNFALMQEFNQHIDYHKGKRTEKTFRFEGLKEQFEKIIGSKIINWEHYGTNGVFQICIAGDQIVYHTDTQQYAAIIFLTPDAPPQTGTTFYRSKYTKYNKINKNEYNIVFKNGHLDSTEFDIIDVIGNIYNRIVLFDAQQIHSASTYFGNADTNGRLFQIFFFDLE
jgi:hypothetical protein